ncbi:hypothetical protein NQZ68_039098 [Dissostichus eleginoides]|nr:hypothetical protein NQZ68_039098 [Dissostichus eleginoides]
MEPPSCNNSSELTEPVWGKVELTGLPTNSNASTLFLKNIMLLWKALGRRKVNMTFGSCGPQCKLRSQKNLATLCLFLAVALLLIYDPFRLIWWPQSPAEKSVALPLDMATDSIDDMYEGCRSQTASVIDLFGVFEWHYNRNFSIAWALVESSAKKPVHTQLKEDHAIPAAVKDKQELQSHQSYTV